MILIVKRRYLALKLSKSAWEVHDYEQVVWKMDKDSIPNITSAPVVHTEAPSDDYAPGLFSAYIDGVRVAPHIFDLALKGTGWTRDMIQKVVEDKVR